MNLVADGARGHEQGAHCHSDDAVRRRRRMAGLGVGTSTSVSSMVSPSYMECGTLFMATMRLSVAGVF